jgi:hypothetical protein
MMLQQLASVHARMALRAECDQILFIIAARLTTVLEMVYLQVLHAAAELATPAVALQHLPM